MPKKRNLDERDSNVPKTTPVEVITEDLTSHPICLHGPTLLFSSEKGRYYACALCRNKECTVHIDEEDWQKENIRKRNEKYYSLIPKLDKPAAWSKLSEVSFKILVSFHFYYTTNNISYIIYS